MSAADAKPGKLFANLTERLTAALIDLILVVALAGFISGVLPSIPVVRFLLLVGLALLYLSAFWSSELRATPGQLVCRLRVIAEGGRGLRPGRAALRATLVVGIFACWYSLLALPNNKLAVIASLVACCLLLLAAITFRRQAGHDCLVRSIVVRAKALRDPRYLPFLAEPDALAEVREKWPRRLRAWDLIEALVLIGGTTFLLHTISFMNYSRELRARASYAVFEADWLQEPIDAFYLENGRLPLNSAELGVGQRTRYPDGGYYEMEPNGVIRIRFEKLEELVAGSISITPTVTGKELVWKCQVHAGFAQAHAPAVCRD